jgi:ABC-type methionine transport system permease subunit
MVNKNQKVPNSELKKAIVLSTIIMVLYAFLMVLFYLAPVPLGLLSLKDLILMGAQIILITTIAHMNKPRKAKIKGIVAVIIFMIIRLAPLLNLVTVKEIGNNIVVFVVFFSAYFFAAILALSALEDIA